MPRARRPKRKKRSSDAAGENVDRAGLSPCLCLQSANRANQIRLGLSVRNMKFRTRYRLLFLAVLVISAAGTLLLSNQPNRKCPAWLVVSKPVFVTANDMQGAHPVVVLTASNAGPQALCFYVHWVESRTRSGLNLVPVGQAPHYRKPVALRTGATKKICLELAKEDDASGPYLFCCRIEWFEKQSGLFPLARQIERPMYWVANNFVRLQTCAGG
jgi:hypothetical protein